MAKSPSDKDQYSEAETERRRDEAIRRALNTPPKPHKEMAGRRNQKPKRKPERETT